MPRPYTPRRRFLPPALTALFGPAYQLLSGRGRPDGYCELDGEGLVPEDRLPASAPGGAPAWGDVTGTLADQIDLQDALDDLASGVAAAVPATRTVNGHALSADVTVSKTDVGLGNADNTTDAGKPVSTATQTALNLKADLAGPALSGVPTAPTAAAATNTTQLATTAFVRAEVAALVASAPGALDTLDELAAAINDDASFAATVTTALGLKAPAASPTFTGVPLAPTAAGATSTTQIATTAFVQGELTTGLAAKQPLDADLTAIAALTTAAFGRGLLELANIAAAKAALDVESGVDVQAYNANLTTFAGIAPAANVQSVLGAADYAAIRVLLGLVIGTHVQAYAANLTTYAGITPSANVQSILGAATYAAVIALLPVFTSLLTGLVPASGGGTTTYLRADGSWATVTATVPDPLVNTFAPGSFTIATGKYALMTDELILTSTQEVTIAGTGELRIC